jgi:alkylated DNA repair protein alkB homolog 1
VRWALRDHARHPNETNLDAHYILPDEGLWNARLNSSDASLVKTRPYIPDSPYESSGPRQLISNTPADPANFKAMLHSPKPPPTPSPTVSSASPAALISKLRWANIGWSYHWGSKQYDFAKGKGSVDEEIRSVCKRAVRSVNWKEVFGQSDEEGWGDEHWRTWHETYGIHSGTLGIPRLTAMTHVEPDAGIVNYYQIKV